MKAEITPKKLLLAAPRGFCAGVEMAIASLDRALALFGAPIFVYHEIVHNKFLVNKYETLGVIFVDDLELVPEGARLLFSAHGVAPQIREQASARRLKVFDATCPLVTKVHVEAKRFSSEGRTLFFIGHRNHDEAVGVMGEAPDKIIPIESIDDAKHLMTTIDGRQQTAFLSQTTMGVDDTREIIDALREQFPDIRGPNAGDICYATQNRQEAVRLLSAEADVVIVIGSFNSSNSQRLCETARAQGKPSYLVDGPSEIDTDWFDECETILLTAGASVSAELVEETVLWFRRHFVLEVQERMVKNETVHFQLPLELRQPES
jgi:4-hydroxy-3-methylbut-2-enyl diphosphate reductase